MVCLYYSCLYESNFISDLSVVTEDKFLGGIHGNTAVSNCLK
jgi:hypothetical protein